MNILDAISEFEASELKFGYRPQIIGHDGLLTMHDAVFQVELERLGVPRETIKVLMDECPKSREDILLRWEYC